MKAITSAFTWAAIVGIVLFALPVLAVVRLFDRDPARYTTGRVFRIVGSWTARINPAWTITHTGTPPTDPRRPYVVVSNHQSSADIPVISSLPWEMKWVAKQALFALPVMGWLMRLAGDIPVDRGNPESRATVLARARRVLEARCSVMFFAEGTRSRDGRLKAFQDGAFRLAIQTGTPVLPLAIDGTMDALPKEGWLFSPARVRLHVCEPVETAGMTEADVPELRERVRATIRDRIAAWREVMPERVDAVGSPPVGGSRIEDASKSNPRQRADLDAPGEAS